MTAMTPGQHLRTLLHDHQLIVAPGVFDGLSAKIAVQAGFKAVYISGGAVARGCGLPDLGLLSMTEVRDRITQICSAVAVPVIADADTGYGNALNVVRTIREFVRTGVAGIQLEDQVTPKKCGHYAGKELISTQEMCRKLTAAREAAPDDLVLIARTDAIATHGVAEALERAKQYARAGADVIFIEAPQTRADIALIAETLKDVPLLINMFEGGRTPLMPAKELADLGYRIMIVPSDLQRAAIRAMQQVAAALYHDGSSAAVLDRMAGFNERDALVDKDAWDECERRYAAK